MRARHTWAAAHGVPLHALAVGEGRHISIRVHALPHVTAPHALGAPTGALTTGRAQGTGRPTLLHTVVRCRNRESPTEKHTERDERKDTRHRKEGN